MVRYAAFHDLAYEPGFEPGLSVPLGTPGREFLRRIQTHMNAKNVQAVKAGKYQPFKGVKVTGILDKPTRDALTPDKPSWQSELVRIVKQDAANPAAAYYTQGARRWQGVDVVYGKTKPQKTIPYLRSGDCSAGVSRWWLWALQQHLGRVPRDIVNACNWQAGYTGTIADTCKRVTGPVQIGDLPLYGSGRFHHVEVVIDPDEKLCGNHGTNAGPNIVRWDAHEAPTVFVRPNVNQA